MQFGPPVAKFTSYPGKRCFDCSVGKPLPRSSACTSAPYSTTTSSSMALTSLQNSFSTTDVGTNCTAQRPSLAGLCIYQLRSPAIAEGQPEVPSKPEVTVTPYDHWETMTLPFLTAWHVSCKPNGQLDGSNNITRLPWSVWKIIKPK